MPSLLSRLFGNTIRAEVERRVKLLTDDRSTFYVGAGYGSIDQRDRFDYDREEILRQAIEAWRTNPLARRIITITSQYVCGGGISIACKHAATSHFIRSWWDHALNQCSMRIFEWCEELVRSGELFFLLSTNAAGMTFIRAVPAIQIKEIQTAKNDMQQEITYTVQGIGDDGAELQEAVYPAYDHNEILFMNGDYKTCMLHYAINRPVGSIRGESDLAPMLKWLSRYSSWLEDRARLNKFRNTFLFVVKSQFASEAERATRQRVLNDNPPTPGSILVTDDSEEWSVIKPELDSFEASADGIAIKKMIAVGAGLPLHFLAEPEGATRTTAESSGGAIFRHLEQRQEFFVWMIEDLTRAVLRRRALVDTKIKPESNLKVAGTDISARDNASLASAASAVIGAFGLLHDKGLIDDAELLRLAYRFAGENTDIEDVLRRRGAKEGASLTPQHEIDPRDFLDPHSDLPQTAAQKVKEFYERG